AGGGGRRGGGPRGAGGGGGGGGARRGPGARLARLAWWVGGERRLGGAADLRPYVVGSVVGGERDGAPEVGRARPACALRLGEETRRRPVGERDDDRLAEARRIGCGGGEGAGPRRLLGRRSEGAGGSRPCRRGGHGCRGPGGPR